MRNRALRKYRGIIRRGSHAIRYSHSAPIRCIHFGARRIRPATKSNDAPSCTHAGTPNAWQFSASQSSPLG